MERSYGPANLAAAPVYRQSSSDESPRPTQRGEGSIVRHQLTVIPNTTGVIASLRSDMLCCW